MKNFEFLSLAEKQMLLKFPAYISLLAAKNDHCLNEAEKKAAIRFCHIKTFTCHPFLYAFYREAEEVFEININMLDNELPKGTEERERKIREELAKLNVILLKLGKEYAAVMNQSMKSFSKHVSRSNRNLLEYFIFPLPIEGITD